VIAGDVSDPRDVEQAVQRTVRTYGNLHLAVNNAGVDGGTQRLVDVVRGEFGMRPSAINLSGVFFGLKYEDTGDDCRRRRAIVNVSSVFR